MPSPPWRTRCFALASRCVWVPRCSCSPGASEKRRRPRRPRFRLWRQSRARLSQVRARSPPHLHPRHRPRKPTPFDPVTPCHRLPKCSTVTRTCGDQSLRLTAIYFRARTLFRPARRFEFHRLPPRSRRPDREPQTSHLAGLSRLIIALALILLAGCNPMARAQSLPTPLPQPTPNRTVDAVVRGLVTVIIPTATRPPGPPAAPPRADAAPRPVQPAATATASRQATTPTPAITPATATQPPRTPSPPEPTLRVSSEAVGSQSTVGPTAPPRQPGPASEPTRAATPSRPTPPVEGVPQAPPAGARTAAPTR